MKKILINYYAIIMMILFIVYNIVLESLKITGPLYQVIMVVFIILNVLILIIFRKDIKFKSLVIIVYFLIWIFSKNILQCLFAISSMITLIIIGFMKNNFIKVIGILITLFTASFFLPLLFGFLLIFGNDFNEETGMNDIYEDMHYICEKNYEVYAYSGGAMDSFHYSIGKHYDILDIDDIIYISYNERNDKTEQEYQRYINNHNCSLVGDKNGFK